MIRYDIQKGVQKIKTKTFLAISGLGLVLGGGAMSLGILGNAHAVAPNCTVGISKDYSTIQAAVNNPACTTITVDPGTYNENVNIAHTLTLNGAQAGTSVSGRTFGSGTESKVAGVNLTASIPTITVSAPNVVIDGFSVTNSVTSGSAMGFAVASTGDNAIIKNNLFDTIVSAGTVSDGQATAQAVYLYGGPDGVQITNNSINNVHSYRSAKGVLLGDNGSTNAPNNTLIQGNTMSGIVSDAKGAYGVSLANITGGTTGLQIKDNSITGLSNTSAGWVHVIGIEGDAPGVVISGNSISNLTPHGTDAVSVWFESEDVHYDSAKVNENNFTQTTVPGIAVGATGTTYLDGTCNYWGDSSGPSNAGGSTATGTGAGVTGLVTFAPWLNSSAPAGACHSGQVKIQIFKYVNGVQATATNANSSTFPMVTTFTSPNLGNANNVLFTLSPTPWGGIGQPYEADFIGSVAGANYTASEVTTGNNVVSTACGLGTPYVLSGYTYGDNLAQAQTATKSLTAPQFTNLQTDFTMIVWNKTCTTPTTKADCRNDGWMTYNNPSFKNQGKCIDYVVKHGHKIIGDDVKYTAYGLNRNAEFEMNTYDNHKGWFVYSDANHDWYYVKVSDVSVSGNNGYFAGQVVSSKNNQYNGNWLFAKVSDNHPDQIWGSFTSQTTAEAGVASMTTNPADGPFIITHGNLKVN